MGTRELYWNLCTYDPRYPLYAETYGGEAEEHRPKPRRKGCCCDPCFQGRDVLAVRVLALEAEAREAQRR